MAHEHFSHYIPVIDGTALTHINSQAFDLGLQRMDIMSRGSVQPIRFAEAAKKPTGKWQTFDLFNMLDAAQLNISLTDGLLASSGNTVLQFQQFSDGGGPNAVDASNHFSITAARAVIGIDSITAEQDSQDPASIDFTAYLLRETGGPTDPDITAVDADLTGTIALAKAYALGCVYDNGTQITGLKGITINTNLEWDVDAVEGELFPTRASVKSRRLEAELTFQQMGLANTKGFGLSLSGGAVDFYFRHLSAGGGRTAKTGVGNDTHLKVSFSSAAYEIKEVADVDGKITLKPMILNTGTVTVDTTTFIPSA